MVDGSACVLVAGIPGVACGIFEAEGVVGVAAHHGGVKIVLAVADELPGLAFLSVGHRPSLLRFHANRLRLLGNDATPSFEIDEIDDDAIARELEANLAL